MRATGRAFITLLTSGWIALPERASAQLNADANCVWLTAGFGATHKRNLSVRLSGWVGLGKVAVGVVRSAEEQFLGPFERHATAVLVGVRRNLPGSRVVVFAAGLAQAGGQNDGGPLSECVVFCTNSAVPVADRLAPAIDVELTKDLWWIAGGSTSITAVGGAAAHVAMAVSFRLGASRRAQSP